MDLTGQHYLITDLKAYQKRRRENQDRYELRLGKQLPAGLYWRKELGVIRESDVNTALRSWTEGQRNHFGLTVETVVLLSAKEYGYHVFDTKRQRVAAENFDNYFLVCTKGYKHTGSRMLLSEHFARACRAIS